MPGVGSREGGHAAPADTRHGAHGLFDLVGKEVAASADDEVLTRPVTYSSPRR